MLFDINSQPMDRLQSPIQLDESCMAPPPATRVPSPRRRSKASPRRRRIPPRASCRIPAPVHAFDQLPWISTLDAAPEYTNPWDIADLSLIPDSPPASDLGPVRRRRSSPRLNPVDMSLSTPPLLLRETSRQSQSVPTPRSHFVPSRVLFHNLMPISCDS